MSKLDIRRLDAPDETRRFEHGSFELVQPRRHDRRAARPTSRAGGGRSTWAAGRTRAARSSTSAWWCRAARPCLMDDGTEVVMEPGDLFHVPPGHDSWVVGDEPYVSLHFMGADDYAA